MPLAEFQEWRLVRKVNDGLRELRDHAAAVHSMEQVLSTLPLMLCDLGNIAQAQAIMAFRTTLRRLRVLIVGGWHLRGLADVLCLISALLVPPAAWLEAYYRRHRHNSHAWRVAWWTVIVEVCLCAWKHRHRLLGRVRNVRRSLTNAVTPSLGGGLVLPRTRGPRTPPYAERLVVSLGRLCVDVYNTMQPMMVVALFRRASRYPHAVEPWHPLHTTLNRSWKVWGICATVDVLMYAADRWLHRRHDVIVVDNARYEGEEADSNAHERSLIGVLWPHLARDPFFGVVFRGAIVKYLVQGPLSGLFVIGPAMSVYVNTRLKLQRLSVLLPLDRGDSAIAPYIT